MTTNALEIYDKFDMLQRTAIALNASSYFSDVKSEAQAIVKVMAGAELGLPPFASMSGIHIVKGKPVLGSNVIATLVKNDPRYDYRIVKSDNKSCVLEWYENGESVGQAGFTIEDAELAGLVRGGSGWTKYPSDMLFARAVSRGARRFAPGIFGGSPVYTPDELNVEVNQDGYVEGELLIEEPLDEPAISDARAVIETEPEPEPETEPEPEIVHPTSGQQLEVNKTVTIPMLKDLHILGEQKLGRAEWEKKCTDIHDDLGTSSTKDWTWQQYWLVYNELEALEVA